jgi:DNA (cytosine-5)-methyltransferase 1
MSGLNWANNVDNPKESPRILSLCSGYGGLELGIESVIGKCTTLAYVEIEAFAITNLVNKMETGALDPVPIWTDIKTFNARPFRGCVDILTGGYPCQPFSAAGKRGGEDDERHIWPYIRTIIMDCKPGRCFFENVEGHLTLGISEVLSDLEAMGYRVAVGIFSAVEVGAPHQRKRVFILAESSESGVWDFNRPPELETGAAVLRQGNRAKRAVRTETTGQIMADCPGDNRGNDSIKETIGEGQKRDRIRKGIRGLQVRIDGRFTKWPARPGQPQHEWEEPRTVANSSGGTRKTGNKSTGREEGADFDRRSERTELADSSERDRGRRPARIGRRIRGKIDDTEGNKGRDERRDIKPELGRTIDGSANRVDRLRLLGNGVVWLTAAKAYYVLSEKLNRLSDAID